MTALVRRPGPPVARVATALAACAIALTPYAAQAQAQTQTQTQTQSQAPTDQRTTVAKTPWKLAIPLSGAESSDFYDVTATGRTDAWAVGRKTDESWSTAPAQLVRRWQECVRAGIEVTQAAGEADPALDADRTAAAVIATVQGGVTVLLSTGSAEHLEAGLNLCLDHLLL